MSIRPLVLLSGLTVADYLLWDWSLGGNHAVLALISGLTLLPLVAACLWLLALNAARLVARSTRRRSERAARLRAQARAASAPAGPTAPDAASQSTGSGSRSSGKLAA